LTTDDQERHAYVICDRRAAAVFSEAAGGAGFRHLQTLWRFRIQQGRIVARSNSQRAGDSRGLDDVLRFQRVMTGGHYPTEQPVALLETLIRQSTHKGEVALDPSCGSGSAGRAARDLGWRGVALRR